MWPRDYFTSFFVTNKVSMNKKYFLRFYRSILSPVKYFLVSLVFPDLICTVQCLLSWLDMDAPYLAQLFSGYSFSNFIMGCACHDIIKVNLSFKLLRLSNRRRIQCVLRYGCLNVHVIVVLIRLHFRLIVIHIYDRNIIITPCFRSLLSSSHRYFPMCAWVAPIVHLKFLFPDNSHSRLHSPYPGKRKKISYHFLHIITFLRNWTMYRCILLIVR